MEGFIKIDYTGKNEEGKVFDTTSKKVAEEAGLAQNKNYYPKIIKVGEHQILPGLDKHLMELSIGRHKLIIPPEEGFGKKSSKLLKLVPTKILKQNNINPYVGQVLDIDGSHGVVRVASGGRTIVDFNHPLAGQKLEYDIEIIKEVTNPKEQVEGMLELMGVKAKQIEVDEKTIHITTEQTYADQVNKMIITELERLMERKVKIEKAKA